MKALVSVLVLVFGLPAMAANNLDKKPCAQFARGAAEAIYLTEATGIQGHEYESYIESYEKLTDLIASVIVVVDGNNDEGDTWTAKFQVEVEAPHCKVSTIDPVK